MSILTVRQLTAQIKDAVESGFPYVWVRGEVTNVSRPSSGHIYFSLKDGSGSLACVMFAGQRKGLAFAMKNLNLIIDAPIIISGYLAPYFTEEDIVIQTNYSLFLPDNNKYIVKHYHNEQFIKAGNPLRAGRLATEKGRTARPAHLSEHDIQV